MTIPEIAWGMSCLTKQDFKQHLRFYHEKYTGTKRERNVRKHRPDQRRREANYPATEGPTKPSLRTEDKYAKSLVLMPEKVFNRLVSKKSC